MHSNLKEGMNEMIFSRKSRRINSTMRKEREHAQRTREHTALIFQKIHICEYIPMIHCESMIESSIEHALYYIDHIIILALLLYHQQWINLMNRYRTNPQWMKSDVCAGKMPQNRTANAMISFAYGCSSLSLQSSSFHRATISTNILSSRRDQTHHSRSGWKSMIFRMWLLLRG